MVAFLYYTSSAIAMHPNPVGTLSDKLSLFAVTVADVGFPEFFQRDDFGNNIKKLEILHSKINPEIFRRLPESLKELSMNSVKDLDGNILTVDQFLESLPHLKTLTLENQHIDDSAISLITQMPGLKNLNLSNNQITGEGFLKILALQGLESLDLSHNQIGSFKPTRIAPVRIKRLNLNHNQIKDQDAYYIAQIKAVEILNLAENQIGDTGVSYIARMQGLETLNLSHNEIGDEGAESLADMQGLKHLLLKSNRIEDAGAAHIAQMAHIGCLELESNQIAAAGAPLLVCTTLPP